MNKLFIDDIRIPPADHHIARSALEAMDWIRKFGVPDFVSFDHDLADGVDGIGLLYAMINEHLDGAIDLSKIQRFTIHSMNPVGSQNLKGVWDSFSQRVLNGAVEAQIIPWRP